MTENDVARSSFNISNVQTAFSHAYRALCYEVGRNDADTSEKSILSCIIHVSDDVLEYRKWIREKFRPQVDW